MAEAAVPTPVRPKIRFGFLLNLSLLGLLLLMWFALSVSTDSFFTANNFENLLRQASLWAIIAVGQTFVIITGGIDLSVGAVVGLSSTIVALLMKAGFPVWMSIGITLLLGRRHRLVPCLRHPAARPAAVHHDARDADGPARHRPADDERRDDLGLLDGVHGLLPAVTSWASRRCSGW